MAEHFKAHVIRQRALYLFALITAALCIGVALSFWYVWNVSAAISEAGGSPQDYATMAGVTTVRPTSTIPVVSFKITSSSSSGLLEGVKFTITSVSGTTQSDFAAAYIFKDINENDIFDSSSDTMVGGTTTSKIAVGATTTIEIDTNFGQDGIQGDTVSSTEAGNWNYILALKTSDTAANGDAFKVTFTSTSDTYILSSGTVVSNGIHAATITVDSAAPTLTATGGPPNGQTGVPVDVMVDREYSENLASATVTTASVLLQANTGNTQGGAPTGANLCNSVSIAFSKRIMCNHVSDGQPLATSTWYTITYGIGISDMAGNTTTASSTYAFQTGSLTPGNNVTPPFVMSSAPQPGSSDFPINGNVIIEFSQPMVTSTSGSVTSTSNISLKASVNGAPSGDNLCLVDGCSLTWSSADNRLVVNPAVNLNASSNYILSVARTTKNAAGIALNNGMNDYIVNFKTASGSDSTAATSTAMYPAAAATGVALNLSTVTVNFSETLNGNSITTSTIQFFYDVNANSALDGGEEVWTDYTATSSLRYDGAQKAVFIGLKKILYQNKQFCVKLVGGASGFTDAVGNQSLSSVKCFTTVNTAYSAVAPTVTMVDADNYRAWVQFSGPIQESTIVSNYFRLQNETSNSDINAGNAVFTYKPERNAVEITGLALTTGDLLKVTVISVKESSGSVTIVANDTTNVGKTKVVAAGGNFASSQPEFTQTNFATFAVSPKRCAPASLSAGKTTRLMCEFPVPTALASGAKIVLTAPVGSSVNSVTALSAANSPMNGDINGPGPGVTTISAVATNTSAGTIELTLAHTGTAMTNSDMLRFELDNFVNPAAGQKTFSAIIKDASGYKQGETIYPAPFTISAAGNLAIGGRVCKSTTSGGTCGVATGVSGVKVMLQNIGSSGSGVMGGTEVATTDGDGAYLFSNLSIGQYQVMMFIDPSTGGTLGGGNNMQMVSLSSSLSTVDFKLTDLSTDGKTLTASISGGPASKDFDLFCYAPGNVSFSAPVMKKGTTDGSGAATVTMKLKASTNYECGIGPSMPLSSMTSGGPPPVPEFSFIPPKPQTVIVGTSDVSVSFVLASASQKIIGKVQDSSGTGIPNVFVQASPVGCFDASTGAAKDCRGSFSQTKSDGTFSVNVTPGTYGIGACSPGMPCSAPEEVTVKANTGVSDSNSDADVYSKGTLLTGTGLTIKMAKSDYTIAGQVQDENSSAIKYAFVNAQKITSGGTCSSFTPEGGFAGSPTDSSGNYTIYVSAGTWMLRAHAPAYGEVGCSVITVTTESKTGQNLTATASDYGTISGTVQKNSTATQGANINCFGSSGGNFAVSGADGTYSMKVKAGTYSCDGFIPGAGQLTLQTSITVTSGQSTTVNMSMGNPGTITVNAGVNDAFCDARSATGRGAGSGQGNDGVYTINVPAGTYTVRCGNPKVGQIGSQSVAVTAGGSHTVTFTAPTVWTVSGIVNDGSSNLEGAFVTFVDKTNGRVATVQSNAVTSGNNVSVALPDGTYSVSANKSGYVDSATPETLVVSAGAKSMTTRTLTKASAAVSVTVQASGANYAGESRIIATKSDGKVVVVSADKAVTSGANASLSLTNGTWSVKAIGDNGKESTATTITVANNTPSSNSITPSLANSITGFTAIEANQQSITPSSGGLFTDSEITNGAASLKVNIGTGVLSTTDATAGTLETKTNPTLAIDSPGMDFIGTSAIDITPKDSSGNAITSLSGTATIEIPYTESDVTAAGVTESKLTCAAWSDASGGWETLPTTVDATNNILTCETTHFSTFGVVAGNSGGSSDSGGSGGSGGGGGGGGSGGGGAVINSNPPVLPKQNTDEKKNAITINAGAKETTSQTVTITLSATNAAEMALSNTADFNGAAYVPYATSASWILTAGNGEKKVYVKFRSKEGGTVDTSDTIILTGQTKEQEKPVVETPKATTPGPSNNASPVAKFMFQKNLTNGAKGNDVKELQKRLRALGLFTYATDTGTYASVTVKAVKAFQKANGLKQTGIVDAATRARLNAGDNPAVEVPKVPTTTTAPAPVSSGNFKFNKNLNSVSRGNEVRELQKRLRALGLFSAPSDNGVYGPATTNAVKAFQKANGLAQVGTLGPQTRAALNK